MVKTLTSESIPGALSSWRISSLISGMLLDGARTTTALTPVSAVTVAPDKMPESMIWFPSPSTATILSDVDAAVTLSFPSPSPVIAACNVSASVSAPALLSGKTLISLLAVISITSKSLISRVTSVISRGAALTTNELVRKSASTRTRGPKPGRASPSPPGWLVKKLLIVS